MAKRIPIVAANWKMYKSRAEARAFANSFKAMKLDSGCRIVICPPYTALDATGQALAGSPIALGAQNMYWEAEGAFTGEVAAGMLKEAGCAYVIIGHSERRRLFGDTDGWVSKKLGAAFKAGLIPICCVGETLEERDGGKTEKVIETQLTGGLAGLTPDQVKGMVIAYEPVWAIGTGRNATPEQAQEVHAFIRKRLAAIAPAAADTVPIQYGGSVKPDNVAAIMAGPDVDGALVGGASLKPDSFAAIVNGAAQARK